MPMALWVFAFEETEQRRVTSASGVEDGEALVLVRLVCRRFWWRYVFLVFVSLGLYAGVIGMVWVLVMEPGLQVSPWVNVAILVVGTFLAAAGLSLGIAGHLRRQVGICLYRPACFRCGYALGGLPEGREGVRRVRRVLCPECRLASPVGAIEQVMRCAPPEGEKFYGQDEV